MSRELWGRRWARIVRPSTGREVSEELEFHVEERVRDYVARGMEPDAARAAALARLGDLAGVRRECTELLAGQRRVEARRDWLQVSWLDMKLGLRMLVKYPGLTIMATLSIAFAIWIGAGTFEFVKQAIFPTLPLPDGDRIVGIELRSAATNQFERRILHDFVTWREELETVDDLGAYRALQRNLITGAGLGDPVEVAEISAAAFRVARVRPLLGRVLVAADERADAAAVAVIGHDIWQARFGGDSAIIGREVSLGRARTTIVGVMPAEFAFPVAQSLWVPLRLDPLAHGRGEGPALRVFGRLAEGASLESAEAEVRALVARAARAYPETHEHLYPEVLPHARTIFRVYPNDAAALSSVNLFVLMLIVLICGNIALLMFARAATRENELVVRSALGAGRGRLVAQLFTESLVLGVIGSALGLAAAVAGLRWLLHIVETAIMDGERLPFWMSAELSPVTYAYAILLTLLTAVITGVLPGLKVTGKHMGARLRQATAGGGGFRFGGIWTWVIVSQVAVTVAFPAVAYITRSGMTQLRELDIGVPTEQYVAARIEMDREPVPGLRGDTSEAAFTARYERSLRALELRLEQAPEVRAVTFGERLPLMYHPHRRIEVEGGGAALTPLEVRTFGDPVELGYRVASAHVALDFLSTLGSPVLQGRTFHSGDLVGAARAVIVNESFVRRVLGGRQPIGQRFRYRAFEERVPRVVADVAQEPWYHIVGVVPDLGMALDDDIKRAGIYHPATPGTAYPANIAVHVRGDAAAFAPTLRAVATAVEHSLRLYGVMPLRDVLDVEVDFYAFWFRLSLMVSGIALALSLAGIYAVMAYTVARRTREIGIRVALGGDARHVVLAIFRRPLIQVSAGIVLGGLILFGLMVAGWGASAKGVAVLSGYALIMLGVCLLACIAPTRRALGVPPTEAMRTEG